MEDTKEIKISGIVDESIVDGPGIRFVVFVQGCSHKCQGCHNQHTQDFNGGKNISVETIIKKVKENPLLDGVTLSGGEPFEQSETVSLLAKQLKQLGYNIITYSGYTYEEIKEKAFEYPSYRELLLNTDILIDGKYEKDKKNLELNFRGSENQRIIDVAASRQDKKIKIIEL